MSHKDTSKIASKRAAKNADRRARRAEKRRAARSRGTDSGSFSESGFGAGEKAPSAIQRAKNVARRVVQGPARAARREQMRRARGGAVPSDIRRGFDIAVGTALIAGTGGAGAGFGAVTKRFVKTAGPGIAASGFRKSLGVLAGAGAGVLIERQLAGRGQQMPHRGAGKGMGQLPGVGGSLPSKDTVVKVWTTGTANFARLLDGRIAVQKKDGTIKTYRPQKHIVIPRNPRVGTLIRADKRLERLTKGLRKVVRTGKR